MTYHSAITERTGESSSVQVTLRRNSMPPKKCKPPTPMVTRSRAKAKNSTEPQPPVLAKRSRKDTRDAQYGQRSGQPVGYGDRNRADSYRNSHSDSLGLSPNDVSKWSGNLGISPDEIIRSRGNPSNSSNPPSHGIPPDEIIRSKQSSSNTAHLRNHSIPPDEASKLWPSTDSRGLDHDKRNNLGPTVDLYPDERGAYKSSAFQNEGESVYNRPPDVDFDEIHDLSKQNGLNGGNRGDGRFGAGEQYGRNGGREQSGFGQQSGQPYGRQPNEFKSTTDARTTNANATQQSLMPGQRQRQQQEPKYDPQHQRQDGLRGEQPQIPRQQVPIQNQSRTDDRRQPGQGVFGNAKDAFSNVQDATSRLGQAGSGFVDSAMRTGTNTLKTATNAAASALNGFGNTAAKQAAAAQETLNGFGGNRFGAGGTTATQQQKRW
ncbi:hypothetical protein DdX_20826 [Ditylenchus destructor]|uniref:Uncharacterized protein n=1 Tax=Ditylenchus destructor TaxID=166010 RepID=A0AAD4MK34_9BILA|nr:hypothetical protein DdX_20826 [Ditylenchus destructor]